MTNVTFAVLAVALKSAYTSDVSALVVDLLSTLVTVVQVACESVRRRAASRVTTARRVLRRWLTGFAVCAVAGALSRSRPRPWLRSLRLWYTRALRKGIPLREVL